MPITGRKGRRFNSRAKKPCTRRSSPRNPSVPIGRERSGTREPAIRPANRVPLGGDPNQFQIHRQRGAVDFARQPDSAVPLARAEVVLNTLTGPCQAEESLESRSSRELAEFEPRTLRNTPFLVPLISSADQCFRGRPIT